MNKKSWVMLLFAAFLMTNVMTPASFAFDEYQETALDKAWDGLTTIGKNDTDKQAILAKNKAERLQRYAEKQAKKAQKEAEKAGGDMKKKLGF